MRKVILSAAVVAMISFASCKNEAKKDVVVDAATTEVKKELAMAEATFGVRGNCGMCKSTIEKAANSVEGVSSANWDKDKKQIVVSFDDSKTNKMALHSAIAASGYDTEKVTANEETYDGLPGCCQYDHEMEMNQSGEVKADH